MLNFYCVVSPIFHCRILLRVFLAGLACLQACQADLLKQKWKMGREKKQSFSCVVTGLFLTVAVNIRSSPEGKGNISEGDVRHHGQEPCLGLASARSAA